MDDKEKDSEADAKISEMQWEARYAEEGKAAALYGTSAGLELRKISFQERMSEETNCFVADIFKKGKKVGEAHNDGHGGDTLARIPNMTELDHKLLTRWVDDTFEAWLKARESTRISKWIEKNVIKNAERGFKTAVIKRGNTIELIGTKLETPNQFKERFPKYEKNEVEIRR
jgi:hypothetical protein